MPLIAGSDTGNPSIIHGPTIEHELAFWIEAGSPPAAALQAATWLAVRVLRVDDRVGLIAPG